LRTSRKFPMTSRSNAWQFQHEGPVKAGLHAR
jgi:hypothetical protein